MIDSTLFYLSIFFTFIIMEHALPPALQLVADYEEMRSLMMSGLFVIPDGLDLSIWHGLLHVREGRYRAGTFRFILVRRFRCHAV